MPSWRARAPDMCTSIFIMIVCHFDLLALCKLETLQVIVRLHAFIFRRRMKVLNLQWAQALYLYSMWHIYVPFECEEFLMALIISVQFRREFWNHETHLRYQRWTNEPTHIHIVEKNPIWNLDAKCHSIAFILMFQTMIFVICLLIVIAPVQVFT